MNSNQLKVYEYFQTSDGLIFVNNNQMAEYQITEQQQLILPKMKEKGFRNAGFNVCKAA